MTNEEIFNNNIKLAYKVANRYKINYPGEYEDIEQLALIGLWKAITMWDHVRPLSTYSYTIMSNDINYYLRSVNKHYMNDISMQFILDEDDDGQNLTLEDILPDNHDQIEFAISEANVDYILNTVYFTKKEKQIINFRLQKITQTDIGIIMNLSQAEISRIQKKIRTKLERRIYYI